jgi:hypothetical protein
MDVLAAVLACSLYPNDEPLVRALATSNSHANPDFVYDPAFDTAHGDPPPEPRSPAQALERVHEVQAKQAVPLLGVLEIPPAWLATFGRELAEGFDPCINVAVGTAYLSAFDRQCTALRRSIPRPPAAERRACVLRRYADALNMPELVLVVALELRAQPSSVATVFEAPIFPTEAVDRWGPDRIFAPLFPSLPPGGPKPVR